MNLRRCDSPARENLLHAVWHDIVAHAAVKRHDGIVVHVVVMIVGEVQDVNGRRILRRHRRLRKALRSDPEKPRFFGKYRIKQKIDPAHLHKHRGVSEPRHRKLPLRRAGDIRNPRHGNRSRRLRPVGFRGGLRGRALGRVIRLFARCRRHRSRFGRRCRCLRGGACRRWRNRTVCRSLVCVISPDKRKNPPSGCREAYRKEDSQCQSSFVHLFTPGRRGRLHSPCCTREFCCRASPLP